MPQIKVIDTNVSVLTIEENDYISLTDMAGAKKDDVRADDVIKNR